MKVAPSVEIEWVDDEAVVLDTSSGELHYLNTSAALVLALIQEHGFDEAMLELKAKHAAGEDGGAQLETLIDQMVEKKLLVE